MCPPHSQWGREGGITRKDRLRRPAKKESRGQLSVRSPPRGEAALGSLGNASAGPYPEGKGSWWLEAPERRFGITPGGKGRSNRPQQQTGKSGDSTVLGDRYKPSSNWDTGTVKKAKGGVGGAGPLCQGSKQAPTLRVSLWRVDAWPPVKGLARKAAVWFGAHWGCFPGRGPKPLKPM